MKLFRTEDGRVSKFIHDDGSETCIKSVYSVDYSPDEEIIDEKGKRQVNITSIDRNKYSIFLSVSTGCAFNCKFCYLTIDEVRFKKIKYEQLINNVKDAILEEINNPVSDIRNRYIKLCWQGMGDALTAPEMVVAATKEILDWVMSNGYALGLDGVDVSSVIPNKKNIDWVDNFIELDRYLSKFNLNPNNKHVVNKESGDLVEYKNRSFFRFFYSLHSTEQDVKDSIIPNTMPLVDASKVLRKLIDGGINVAFHYMFLDKVNDNHLSLIRLVSYMSEWLGCELRVLRYNKHKLGDIVESKNFEDCICFLRKHMINVKVQVSYGKDVKSACGQFVYNDVEDVKKFSTDLIVKSS